MNIPSLLQQQRAYFKTQQTKDVSFRINVLKKLKQEIVSREQDVYSALKKDFNKSSFEAFMSEYGIVLSELNLAIKKLKSWSKPKRVKPSMLTFPATDYIYKEPYGTVLVIAPWNYPFLLAIEPLIMAISAGNTVIVKPSELTIHTSQLVTEIIQTVFNKQHATSIEGGIPVATELLEQKWDYIFFTGSVPVGKIVAKAAAKHLTPVTLELGGKSPCIVDETINLKLAAKRIVWGKFFNGGQTCISPDYIIAHTSIKKELINALKKEIINAYGENPKSSKDFPRIINERNANRLKDMLEDANIVYGGEHSIEECYIAPTLVDNPSLNSKLMQDEIFGPILPILTYADEAAIGDIISNYDKPLSLYVFSKNKQFTNNIIKNYSFGGGAVNDPLIHFGNHKLPFGGVGASGIGAYHGKHGFDTFSHHKSISKRGTWFDPPVRYAPYKGKIGLLKKMFKWFG
ncbi:aldehyde dehydrogenase [Pontimicrobium aquaticum]|uniref:Aldehyde dehydrogenase n=1 Tax=Pontimicrobium aquaticum TaxID=2565367 RepID=A0A4U0EQF4_9FLAO|nr:aldehyde dehydrogenase [Pontimicrobium aquaticum]TJY33913.1 aldehyde dehydrogenase [Pontimicrobium aquaticum]